MSRRFPARELEDVDIWLTSGTGRRAQPPPAGTAPDAEHNQDGPQEAAARTRLEPAGHQL